VEEEREEEMRFQTKTTYVEAEQFLKIGESSSKIGPYHSPDQNEDKPCEYCGALYKEHGCPTEGVCFPICPGTYVITTSEGFHTMRADAFEREHTPAPERKFPMAIPHKWRNKLKPETILKVVPWFQPLDNSSEFDFVGLFKECFPEMANDLMGVHEVYKGLVMQVGWQFKNTNDIWFCGPMELKEHFEDLGPWPDGEEYKPKKIGKKKAKKRGSKKARA
jgi:hypothetical protein